MSKSKDNQNAPLTDLSSLDFGPAWAREKKSTPDKGGKKSSPQKRGSQRRTSGDSPKRPPRKHGKQPRDRDAKQKPRRAPAPEGVTARIMPIEEGVDALAKRISQTGRTHSVFDLAWVVLGNREGCKIIFESEHTPLYQCKSDHSVWLTQSECIAHLWAEGVVEKHYAVENVEVDPPSGNFQSVARCGMSGELLGAPNHHAYQQTLLDFQRERFPQMSLDRFKEKIVMEHGEEAVQQWLESMKVQKHWRAIESPTESPTAPAEETTDDPATEETPQEGEPVTETIEAPPAPVFHTRKEVEQHFLQHGYQQEVEEKTKSSVTANVPAKMLSPGLLTLLIDTFAEEKRYPGQLASFLCRQMTGRHLAVFKWRKRLHCGPSRPRNVPDDLTMADRPTQLMQWVLSHPNGDVDKLWEDVLPADTDEETRHQWYHDLHWLINEGYALLFSDGTLHAAREAQKQPASPSSKKPNKKEVEKSKDKETKQAAEAPKENPTAADDNSSDAGTSPDPS